MCYKLEAEAAKTQEKPSISDRDVSITLGMRTSTCGRAAAPAE